MMALLSAVSVCLFVCQHDNSRTITDIITKFSGHLPMVSRADMFENGNLYRGAQVEINITDDLVHIFNCLVMTNLVTEINRKTNETTV